MSDTLRAIVLMTAAMAAFATADLSISLLPDEMPSSQILIVLGVGGATVFGTLAKLKGLRLLTPLWRDPGVLARNGSELIGTMGIVTALTLIPFSQASSIMQAVPLVVTAGAAVLLREPVGFYRWAAVLVGFLGVLVIVAPDPGDSLGFGTLAAVIGMLGLSARDLATRFVPPGAHTLELSFLAMATSIPAGLILRAMTGDPFMVPDTRAVLLLGQMIAAATAAYFCVTAAMRLGDISAVAPFRYTRILFAFALAVVVVGEMLSTRMVVGTVLVVGAGLFTLWREQKAARALGSPDRAR